MDSPSPALPPHIDETVKAIAKLHADHRRQATPLQRVVEQMTAHMGRPRFVGLLTAVIVLWIVANAAMKALHKAPFDSPPYPWLVALGELVALYLTVLILMTQRRERELVELRAQLTLELAITGEQKTAKIIELLEEMRRDNPLMTDRTDAQADAMSTPSDPESVLDALRTSHEDEAALDGEATASAGRPHAQTE